MKWLEIDKDEAQRAFEDYCASKKCACPSEYKQIRDELCQLFVETLSEIGIGPESISKKNYSYQVDYIFGMKMYLLLNEKYDMNIRTASTAGIWRFLSVFVIPDVIEMRYSIEHEDRYWKKSKRLWLRVIWWYIYLSWQGSEEETKSVIKDNSTDEILQLVDRCGRGGYRVELYREMMRQNSMIPLEERRKTQLFRKMMVLNTARVQVIEPELVDGGEKQYVSDLRNYFDDSKE